MFNLKLKMFKTLKIKYLDSIEIAQNPKTQLELNELYQLNNCLKSQ